MPTARSLTTTLLPAAVLALLGLGAVIPDLSRSMQALVAVALVAALVGVGRWCAGWLLPGESGLSRVTCAAVVALGLATLIPTVLGHLGLLRPPLFLALVAIVYGTVAFAPRREAAADASPVDDEAPRDPAASPILARLDAVLLGAAGLALAAFMLATIHELRHTGPGWFGLDDNSYHSTAVAVWAQHGDLRMPKLSYGDPSTPFYPIGSELVAWSLLAPFRDSDVLSRWAQLPFHLASLLAVAAVARGLGLSHRGAGFAALLYGAVPRIFPGLALTAGNDCATAFYAVAAVDAALALGRRPGRGPAVYLGLALGLLAGTKYIGLLFAAPILGLAVLASIRRKRAEASSAPTWTPRFGVGAELALTIAIALLAGGSTYVRNAVVAGNPIFPSPVSPFGRELLPGWAGTSLSSRLLQPEAAIDLSEFLLERSRTYGSAFRFTLLPAALLAPVLALALHRRPRGWRLVTAAVLALPVVFFLEFLFLMHDHRDVRYVAAALALAAVAFAWLVEALPPPAAVALRGLALLALLAELGKRTELTYIGRTLVVLLFLALAWTALRLSPLSRSGGGRWERGARGERWLAPAAAILLALAAVPLGASIETYQRTKLDRIQPHAPEAPIARALEALVGPDGATVAYAGWNRPYLFYGSRLQNEVAMVPTVGGPEARFYDWGGSPGLAYDGGTFRRWRRNLEMLGVEYLVIVRSDGEDPERRWMMERPRLFRRVHEDAVAEIWRVRGGRR